MREGEEEAPAAGDGSPAARIYVGGLSASVTAADMEKAFSSLGRVTGVEFVCKDDRTFAYMDFEPTSDKAMAKLFSAYNGCTWKGGKLKLEKAKGHYLVRMKREWAEDSNHVLTTAVNPIAEKNASHSNKLELLDKENTQLRIFFPKLRKVKPLPFKGTGKHKYSFQRIEVPPLPIHFCDCEEHYDPSETASHKYSTSLNKVIHEKELRIMSSVMNRLFGKEDSEAAAEKITKLATDTSISNDPIDNIRFEEAEAEAAKDPDADNLVTNIGIGGGDDMLMQYKRGELSLDQETINGNLRPMKGGSTQNKADSRRRQKAAKPLRNKRVDPILEDKLAEDESTPILPPCGGHPHEPEIFAEAPPVKTETEPNMDAEHQSRKGNSWLQKSSWKDLVGVGGGSNSSFSISNVLTGTDAMAPELPKASAVAAAAAAAPVAPAPKKRKAETDGEIRGAKSVEARPVERSVGIGAEVLADGGGGEGGAPGHGDQEEEANRRKRIPRVGISDVCTFMRSAESEKEWAKAKAALSGYISKDKKNKQQQQVEKRHSKS